MQHPRDLNVCIMIKCGLVAQKEIHYVYKKTSKSGTFLTGPGCKENQLFGHLFL